MAFRAQDAEIFVSDGELAKLADGTEFRVVLDYAEDVEQFMGQSKPGQVAGHPQITYVTAAPGRTLKAEDVLTVEDEPFKVRYSRKLDDGLHSLAMLKKGSA